MIYSVFSIMGYFKVMQKKEKKLFYLTIFAAAVMSTEFTPRSMK